MNKYQEALNRIAFNFGLDCLDENITEQEQYNLDKDISLMNELVERATPKKPAFDKSWEDEETKDIYNEDGLINEILCKCPNCHKHGIYDFEYGARFNHCHECGQAIDWSEEE